MVYPKGKNEWKLEYLRQRLRVDSVPWFDVIKYSETGTEQALSPRTEGAPESTEKPCGDL